MTRNDKKVVTKLSNILTCMLNGISRFLHVLTRLNWLGRTIVIGLIVIIAAAVTLIVVLPIDTPAVSEVMTELPAPTGIFVAQAEQPTESPIPTTPPEPTIDPVLEKGDESIYVQALQDRLMDLGYMELDESTQLYGPATKYAVGLFQRQHDLQQDGIAGQETLNMIFSDAAKKYTMLEGTSGTDVDSMQRQLVSLGYLNQVTRRIFSWGASRPTAGTKASAPEV